MTSYVWAFLFLPVVGLNPICGILAIGVPYAGVFAKVYAEILQEADRRPLNGLPPRTGDLSRFFYGVLPVAYPDLRAYTSYRLECALRSSAILGFIGLPTLGFHLETAFREGLYAEAPALLYAFYLLIASLRWWVKPRLVPLYVAASFALISTEVHVSWENIRRFLTYEILPWPMRSEGYYAGTGQVVFDAMEVGRWAWDLALSEVLHCAQEGSLEDRMALVELYRAMVVDAAYRPIERVDIPHADALPTPLPSAEQYLHSFGALECLECCASLLRPGGWLLINDYEYDASKIPDRSDWYQFTAGSKTLDGR